MRLLLDTHVFLWFISSDSRLKSSAQQSLCDPSNDVFLSVVSVWEATVKHALGKLPLPQSPGIYLPTQRIRHQIDTLSLDENSIAHLNSLPNLHRDPFDRMLVCQALEHNLTLVTVDKEFQGYPIQLLEA